MKVKRYLILLITAIVLIFSKNTYSQNKEIKIGQKCPDAVLRMFNYKDSIARVSDFKGRLLILDFWATYCSSCIVGLKKNDSLEHFEYKNKIRFIPITHESRSKVAAFWKKNSYTKNLKLPTVIEDTLLNIYFPHITVGHQVWIGKDGKVLAITDAEYVNAKNIGLVLADEEVRFPQRKETEYNYAKPMFQIDGQFRENLAFSYHSGMSSFLRGSLGTKALKYDTTENMVRAYSINAPILDLYKQALVRIGISPNSSRFILETNDSSRFYIRLKKSEYDSQWEEQNSYCYEQTVPVGTSKDSIVNNMIFDLNRYLKLKGRLQQRIVKCWIIKGKNPLSHQDLFKNSNFDYKSLVTSLNHNNRKLPIVINESISKGEDKIPPEIYKNVVNNNNLSLKEINRSMMEIGLTVSEENRMIKLFILSDL